MTPARQRRALRVAHLFAGVIVLAYVYPPLGPELEAAVRFAVFPILVLTGIAMWQSARIRRVLRSLRPHDAWQRPPEAHIRDERSCDRAKTHVLVALPGCFGCPSDRQVRRWSVHFRGDLYQAPAPGGMIASSAAVLDVATTPSTSCTPRHLIGPSCDPWPGCGPTA
jgi:hypothetical protein